MKIQVKDLTPFIVFPVIGLGMLVAALLAWFAEVLPHFDLRIGAFLNDPVRAGSVAALTVVVSLLVAYRCELARLACAVVRRAECPLGRLLDCV